MNDRYLYNLTGSGSRRGVSLLLTLVLLVVLSMLGYTLTSRVAAQRNRNNYLINYQSASYARDSAVKYALTILSDINDVVLISRPNEPDFSDLFSLSEAEYEEFLLEWNEWVIENSRTKSKDKDKRKDKRDLFKDANGMYDFDDINDMDDYGDMYDYNDMDDFDDINDINDVNGLADFNEPNTVTIRGPYGPAWPHVIEPIEFEIDGVEVTIEIEDENAKYPLGWALLEDEEIQREASAGFRTFCEWMDINSVDIDELEEQLERISEIKTFTLDPKPIKLPKEKAPRRRRTSRRSKKSRAKKPKSTRPKMIPASVHTTDFAKIFNSSMLNTDILARPTVLTENRQESALKYMGMWSSRKVNINTAPRQVLEAAFVFGGDAEKIAEEIIIHRRKKPFRDIEDLRQTLFRHSVSIEKCKKYITTFSTFFTIKITAVSGNSKATAVIAVTVSKNGTQPIAVLNG